MLKIIKIRFNKQSEIFNEYNLSGITFGLILVFYPSQDVTGYFILLYNRIFII